MKLDIKYIYGIVIGMIISSLILALRYENNKLRTELLLFLQEGINPFWTFFIADVYLFIIIPLIYISILMVIKIIKRKRNSQSNENKNKEVKE